MYKSNEEGQETKWRAERTYNLLLMAQQQNVIPCEICKLSKHPKKCNSSNCYCWETWFREKWRNIREAARQKGYNV